MQVLDVALVTTHKTFENVSASALPVRNKTYVGHHVWLGGLDRGLEHDIMTACEPHGLVSAPRLHQPLYTFHRAVETDAPYDSEHWDPGGFMRRAVLCSHLARSTTAGLDYAARVIDGKPRQVVPMRFEPGKAWLLDMPPREARTIKDWLTIDDATLTAQLVEASFATNLPRRVKDAFFFFEYAHYIVSTNVRWPVLATASEALLKVYGEKKADGRFAGSTEVFVNRMKRLADLVASPTDEDELRAAYTERSRLVHTGMFAAVPLLNGPEVDGTDPQGFTAERRHLYALHEEVLRRALMRCVLEPEFAQMFASDEAVTRNFPLK